MILLQLSAFGKKTTCKSLPSLHKPVIAVRINASLTLYRPRSDVFVSTVALITEGFEIVAS